MTSFRRVLLFAVVIVLALPAAASADPGMTVQRVWTDKATYASGDPIQCTAEIDNSLGGSQLAQGSARLVR